MANAETLAHIVQTLVSERTEEAGPEYQEAVTESLFGALVRAGHLTNEEAGEVWIEVSDKGVEICPLDLFITRDGQVKAMI